MDCDGLLERGEKSTTKINFYQLLFSMRRGEIAKHTIKLNQTQPKSTLLNFAQLPSQLPSENAKLSKVEPFSRVRVHCGGIICMKLVLRA